MVRRRAILAAALLLCAGAMWSYRHVMATVAAIAGEGADFGVVYTAGYVFLVAQLLLAFMERTWTCTRRQQAQLDALNVAVSVPVFNEDPEALRRGLESLFLQSRPPNTIFVVDDGTKPPEQGGPNYEPVKAWFLAEAHAAGIRGEWVRQRNGGKRSAQGRMVRDTPEADAYITLDSDALLDPNAIDEILKPLADPDVQSVAGIVLHLNNTGAKAAPTSNILRRLEHSAVCRVTSLWYGIGQMIDRSAMSAINSVLVNSGALAVYRADVLRDNLEGYLNEFFFKRRVEMSDDSMLTTFALMRGKAVQQPTAFAFTLMPERVSHHVRQYVRWMRGAFIRGFWRFRYLPTSRAVFWLYAFRWVQIAIATVILVVVAVVRPAMEPRLIAELPYMFLIPAAIAYMQALRFLMIQRNDDTLLSQLGTVALAPVATVWAFIVLRMIRWYSTFTCLTTGWGTRQSIEVAMNHHGEDATVLLDRDAIAQAAAQHGR